MNQPEQLDALLQGPVPFLALAPMQGVTDGAFWRLMHHYGGADVYWTEYFRVHASSRLEKWIVQSIEQNSTGRPVVAQMIGNDIPSLVRTAKELQHLDFNREKQSIFSVRFFRFAQNDKQTLILAELR